MVCLSFGARVRLSASRRIKAGFSRARDRPIAQIVFVYGDIQNPVQRIFEKLLMKKRFITVHFPLHLVADIVGKARNQNTKFRLYATRVDTNPLPQACWASLPPTRGKSAPNSGSRTNRMPEWTGAATTTRFPERNAFC